MANHKSAKKRIRQNERRRVINKNSISKMKTLMKRVFGSEDKETVEKYYKAAVSHIDKITVKGRLHINNAARKKAKLTRHLNNVVAAN